MTSTATGDRDRLRIHPVLVTVLAVVLSAAFSAYAGYASATSALNARVSVLESQFQALHGDIQDIKVDVRKLLER